MESTGPVYLSSEQISPILTYNLLITAVERGLGLFSARQGTSDVGCTQSAAIVNQPVRSVVMIPPVDGFLGCMPVYVQVDELLVTKLVTFFPKNQNSPTHHAVVVVFNANTGVPRAILDGETITTRRTAAASAVATKHLASRNAKILALIGSGVQATSHYHALSFLFNFEQVRVWNHRPEGAKNFVSDESRQHKCVACDSVEDAVKDADVIVTVTSSKVPLVMAPWVKAGAHVNAVGACRPDWAELDPDLVRSSVIYVDSKEAALKESGDIIQAKADIFAEIGDVINGTKPAHQNKTTVFKSLGMAMEDAVAAKVVLDQLKM